MKWSHRIIDVPKVPKSMENVTYVMKLNDYPSIKATLRPPKYRLKKIRVNTLNDT